MTRTNASHETRVDELIDSFHRVIVDIAVVALPIGLVIDTIGSFTAQGSRVVRWPVYLALWLIVLWERRKPRPSASALVLAAVGYVGATVIVEALTGVHVGARDSATTVVLMVTLGMAIIVTWRQPPQWLLPTYAGATVLVTAAGCMLDGSTAVDAFIRVGLAGLLVWLGSTSLLRMKGDLERTIARQREVTDELRSATRINLGLAMCSNVLLHPGLDPLADAVDVLIDALEIEAISIDIEKPDVRSVAGGDWAARDGHLTRHDISLDAARIGQVRALVDDENHKRLDAALDTVASMIASYCAREDAIRRLENTIRSKDELVASVSHELRTPLTGVLGFAEAISDLREDLPPDVQEFVDLIIGQGKDMSDIIEDLLAAARAEIGRLTVDVEEVDLMSQVRSVIETAKVRGLAGEKDIEIRGTSATAIADPLRTRQIIRNLVTNAVRYGGPNVIITVSAGDRWCLVEVEDDGEGLSRDEEMAVFEPYYRARQVPTQPGSVGLGLPVSRQLARLMGGDVDVARRAGRQFFTLILPSAGRHDVLPTTKASLSRFDSK